MAKNGKDEFTPPEEEGYIGAIDQGTTSTRFLIYDRNMHVIGSHQVEFTQYYPEAGWVEHDPMELVESVRVCITKAIDKATASGYNVDGGLKAIGITNQRETIVLWSKSTGLPLYNAIVWMDVRTSAICRRLEEKFSGGKNHFVNTCGLPISTYFSAVKLLWLMENVDGIKDAIASMDVLFGTVDTWLIWNLTGGRGGDNVNEKPVTGLHVTDCSNAARTMLMNINTLEWDKPTLDALGIPIGILPKIVSNSEIIGTVATGWPIAGVQIAGCLGDQHAAMLGHACQKGQAKCTYGTGAFILINTGEEIVQSTHGLLTTVAFKLGPNAPTDYALEGSIAIAGAAVQWLRDSVGIINSAAEIEELAASVPNSGGVYFVPAFNGLFAPWWRDDARGVLIGITRFTSNGHIARAVLESICFQVHDVLSSMYKDTGLGDNNLKDDNSKDKKKDLFLWVDGGAAANDLLLQTQADLLRGSVVKPADIETTSRGAAFAAGLACGFWKKEEIFGEMKEKFTVYESKLSDEVRKKKLDSWMKAVSRTFDLADLAC